MIFRKLSIKFNKKQWYKVYTFKNDKTVKINFYHKENDKDKLDHILINSNHVFLSNGYSTILTSDNKAESINPLDLESKYNVSDFKTAINSKLIKDTFNSTKPKLLDKIGLLLIANIIGIVLILWYVIQLNGGIS